MQFKEQISKHPHSHLDRINYELLMNLRGHMSIEEHLTFWLVKISGMFTGIEYN